MLLRAETIAPDLWDALDASYERSDYDDQSWRRRGRGFRTMDISRWVVATRDEAHEVRVTKKDPVHGLGKLMLPTELRVFASHFYPATEVWPASSSECRLRFDRTRRFVSLTGRYLEADYYEGEVPPAENWEVVATGRQNVNLLVTSLQDTLIRTGVLPADTVMARAQEVA